MCVFRSIRLEVISVVLLWGALLFCVFFVGLVVAGDFRLAGWVARVYVGAVRGSVCVGASPVDICVVSVVGTMDINQYITT
jgi:hypothetical protein